MREMREAVVEAAIKEFTKSGLKFTMNDIAKNMKISKKTIYTVFESKEAVLGGIADKYFEDFLIIEKRVMEDDKMDVIEKIEIILCALPAKYQDAGLGKLSELNVKYPRVYKRLMDYVAKGWGLVETYLEQGIREKKFREISIPVVMTMIEGSVIQLIKKKGLSEYSITYEQAKKEIVQVLIEGIQYKE